eukprot:CAMPEP_0176343692 /NCGR_PEP_ID=MMETSP0126-20121128/4126_1 /TAXON_ID=141414 ORGANISM="Strombidinopsis acuminatum, Strain SPMC142" /NCGR_SAMPLE_ID=MMETSP0126 /ASSEMBLY_ACC=CAM_ASM_000229 /LENGTH=78 /DNA_ID=CAMNT_0017689751 /DNA_START=269 /DNA_END=505 /DNA_ORIENTATION=+
MIDYNIGLIPDYDPDSVYSTYFTISDETNISGLPIFIDAIDCSIAFAGDEEIIDKFESVEKFGASGSGSWLCMNYTQL